MSTEKFFCVSQNEKYNDIQNDGKDVQRINIIRREHPNCAIFKKTVSTIDEEIVRTTLYTPGRRISQDVSKADGTVRSNYATTESHLETLLIYLKDIEVKINDAEIISAMSEGDENRIYVGELCSTPYTRMLDTWMSSNNFETLSETKVFASCIYHMKKLLRAQMACAEAAVKKYNIKYFTFGDVLAPIEQDKFDKYYYKYYREAAREYEGLNMVIKIRQPLFDFEGRLDRKHIRGVVLVP